MLPDSFLFHIISFMTPPFVSLASKILTCEQCAIGCTHTEHFFVILYTYCSLFNWQPSLLTIQYVNGFWYFSLIIIVVCQVLYFNPVICSLASVLLLYYFFHNRPLFHSLDVFGSCSLSLTLFLSAFIFFWFAIYVNGCFNAVISCFITDKILHLTLTNNMPLRCRCSLPFAYCTQSTTKLNEKMNKTKS